MSQQTTQFINAVDATPSDSDDSGLGKDCGLGHACNFCPRETQCQLDKTAHNTTLVNNRLSGINWIILVMANKGGIGKSTVAANLSVALADQGYSVGLGDADVHGPNAPRILGLQDARVKVGKNGIDTPRYQFNDNKEVQVGSLGFFLEQPDTPVVWRDSYKHDYIHHLIGSCNWGALDFLVIDMPPGTGNELITLTDMLEGSNLRSLMVSSADAIALQDSLKAARFSLDKQIPVLGLVENYAGTMCPHCGGEIDLFPRAEEIESFEAMGIPTLARLPFASDIAQGAAQGKPAAGNSESVIGQLFAELATKCSKSAIAEAKAIRQDFAGTLDGMDTDIEQLLKDHPELQAGLHTEELQQQLLTIVEQEQQRLLP
jgi:ATP-binding protein involved in chromosome partitioning